MTNRYKHTQTGYLIIFPMTLGMLLIGYLIAVYGFNWSAFVVLVILAFCLALFSTLTVIIDEGLLVIRFGPGIIRKSFHLKDIASCQVVKNPWYYGWGIRLTPHGWLYNISGFNAVEISMKAGKKYRIGTDVPHDLEAALREGMRKA